MNNITFVNDLKIIIKTVGKVFKRSDIAVGKEFKITRFLEERANWEITPEGAIDPEGKK